MKVQTHQLGVKVVLAFSFIVVVTAQAQPTSQAQPTEPTEVVRDRFNYTILASLCRQHYSNNVCSASTQFCEMTSDCPQEHFCSCMEGCGRLRCIQPENVKVCPFHSLPRNGFSIRAQNMIEFRCNPGYYFLGPRRKKCVAGVWQPIDEFPLCKAVTCKPLPQLANGEIMLNPANRGNKFGTNATVMCNTGYSLVNERSRRCMHTGIWSGRESMCHRDGQWSDWMEWSDCDARVCGHGNQVRTRHCQGQQSEGKPCLGMSTETRVCVALRACQATTSTATEEAVSTSSTPLTTPTMATRRSPTSTMAASQSPTSTSDPVSTGTPKGKVVRNRITVSTTPHPARTSSTAAVEKLTSPLVVIEPTAEGVVSERSDILQVKVTSPEYARMAETLPARAWSNHQLCQRRKTPCHSNRRNACLRLLRCILQRNWRLPKGRGICSTDGRFYKNHCLLMESVCLEPRSHCSRVVSRKCCETQTTPPSITETTTTMPPRGKLRLENIRKRKRSRRTKKTKRRSKHRGTTTSTRPTRASPDNNDHDRSFLQHSHPHLHHGNNGHDHHSDRNQHAHHDCDSSDGDEREPCEHDGQAEGTDGNGSGDEDMASSDADMTSSDGNHDDNNDEDHRRKKRLTFDVVSDPLEPAIRHDNNIIL